MEIDGASNNSVNDIRDLRERVKYAPAGGRYKVYIIDEAHMLSDSAFNALLKTLEEPPPHVVFVLATTAARKVPATVLSRCQHLPFRRVPVQKIKERLRLISESEGIRISDAAMELVARAAEGSMRDSLTILDQVSAFASEIGDVEIRDLLGIADFKALADLSAAVIEGDRKRILEIITELADTGTDFKSFAKDLMNFFRDLLVARVVERPTEILDVTEGELDVMSQILKTTSEDYLTVLLGEMIKAEADVRFAFSPRIGLEMALLRASFLESLKPVKEAIENIEAFLEDREEPHGKERKRQGGEGPTRISGEERTGQTKSRQVREKKSPALLPAETAHRPSAFGEEREEAAHPSPDDVSDIPESPEGAGDLWDSVIRKIEKINHPLASKLAGAAAGIDGGTLTITFNGGTSIHVDSVKKNQQVIEQIASEIAERKMSLKIETIKRRVAGKKELKEKVLSEPIVKEALALFDGRIVHIRPTELSENGGRDV
jgi:DNA polymerase-3 subunit gamma/tau